MLRKEHHNRPKNHEQKNYYIVENFLNLIIIHITPLYNLLSFFFILLFFRFCICIFLFCVIGIDCCNIAYWMMQAMTVGIPNFRISPSGFGISTLLTGNGVSCPFRILSGSSWQSSRRLSIS